MNKNSRDSFERLEYLQKVNYELMDSFRNGLFWLIGYCEKNHIPLPDLAKIQMLIGKSGSILEQSDHINREVTRRNTNLEGNSTHKIKSYIVGYFNVR